jgi:hypothetical protein
MKPADCHFPAAGQPFTRLEPRIPLWIKQAYTAFMAVLVPVYWHHYGWTNFLYFCDVALFLTLAGLWREDRLLLSLSAVGILLPQMVWCADFGFELAGLKLTGMTSYMFDEKLPLYLRGLSLFHGWLPWLLLFAVSRVGYDERALRGWALLAGLLCLVAFFWLPPAGAELENAALPRNVKYVFGLDDAKPQNWLPPAWYLVVWISALVMLVYWPTHQMLKRWRDRDAGV